MSVFAMVQMAMYKAGDGYNELTAGKYGTTTIGNLGYSSVQCSIIPFNFDRIGLNCPYGSFGKIVEGGVGINEASLSKKSFCQVTESKVLLHWAALRGLTYTDDNQDCSNLVDR